MEQPVQTTSEEEARFDFLTKEVEQEHYELLALFTSTETEEQANQTWETVKKEITDLGGTLTHDAALGSKTLAYTVAGKQQGYYFVAEFDIDKPQFSVLSEKLRIRKDVTRYLIIKKRVKSAEEIADDARIREKIDARRKTTMLAKMAAEPEVVPEEKPVRAPRKPRTPVSAAVAAETAKTAAAEGPAASEGASTPADTTSTDNTSSTKREGIEKEIEKLLSDDIDV